MVASAAKARGVLMVKILNECIQSTLVYTVCFGQMLYTTNSLYTGTLTLLRK